MRIKTLASWAVAPAIAICLSLASMQASALPSKTTAAGDSITMGFAADCRYNYWFWDLFCLLGGDQPEHSWFDGWDSSVNSVHDKYKQLNGSISANKSAAASGSELRGGSNNFATQAANIVAQSTTPDHVEVLLGGNDICNRDCTDPANCTNPLYTDSQWRSSVQAGLNTLVSGLPSGSTVYLGGVPRVQDLRAAGLAKQATTYRIRCENIWNSYDICSVATYGGTMNGESSAQRLAAIEAKQQRYNEILAEEAASYNGTNGVEVVASYQGENASTVGTFSFQRNDIDGGDCFHPSLQGQNTAANLMWNHNPDK
ncbi:MAG: peptidase [Oleiphilus sp.]|nr:MAG: peptidase [Oleiphilus sp.]